VFNGIVLHRMWSIVAGRSTVLLRLWEARVCGERARWTLTRVIAVVLAVFAFPFGLIAYLVLWVIMPQEVPLLPATTNFDTA